MLKANELRWDEGLCGADALLAAWPRVRPVTKSVAAWTRLAVQDADDLDLVPEAYRYLLPTVEAEAAQGGEQQASGDEDAEMPVVVSGGRG